MIKISTSRVQRAGSNIQGPESSVQHLRPEPRHSGMPICSPISYYTIKYPFCWFAYCFIPRNKIRLEFTNFWYAFTNRFTWTGATQFIKISYAISMWANFIRKGKQQFWVSLFTSELLMFIILTFNIFLAVTTRNPLAETCLSGKIETITF